jgi:hypothetical protein
MFATTPTVLPCLATLSASPPSFGRRVVAVGAATLGAAKLLMHLRVGPIVLPMCGITLLTDRPGPAAVLGLAAAVFVVLWFSAGRTLDDLPDYARNSFHIIRGYTEAMAAWPPGSCYLPSSCFIGILAVAAAALT